MSGGPFRGVSGTQDGRFNDKTKKLLKSTKFPDSFSTKVDMSKVKMEAMLPWITTEVAKYLGFEDEVVIGYIESQLEEAPVDPRKMQIALTGFLEKNTITFMRDLWVLLISAQSNETGIPAAFLDMKKEELRLKKEEAARLQADLQARSQSDAAKQEDGILAAARMAANAAAASLASRVASTADGEVAAITGGATAEDLS